MEIPPPLPKRRISNKIRIEEEDTITEKKCSLKICMKHFLGSTVDKEPFCQFGGHGFNPLSGKIPPVAGQLSP